MRKHIFQARHAPQMFQCDFASEDDPVIYHVRFEAITNGLLSCNDCGILLQANAAGVGLFGADGKSLTYEKIARPECVSTDSCGECPCGCGEVAHSYLIPGHEGTFEAAPGCAARIARDAIAEAMERAEAT